MRYGLRKVGQLSMLIVKIPYLPILVGKVKFILPRKTIAYFKS
jgi:hypothetical protein